MKTLILLIVFALSGFALNAQPFFALHHSGNINYYKSFQEAFGPSVNGDTIYVPGGTFNVGTVTIDRKLCIYGVGYYPDSCKATTPSILIGNLRILTGADNGLLSGLEISGGVQFGTAEYNQTVNNYTITRCLITSYLYLSYNGSVATNSENIILHESVIFGAFCGGYAQSTHIVKNYFSMPNLNYQIRFFSNSLFQNNIFAGLISASFDHFADISDCIFENNVIITLDVFTYYVTNNTFLNNLFTQNASFPTNGNDGSSNIVGQAATSIFTNDPSPYSYSFSDNYELFVACPGNNAGTDGYDVGIFGTKYPFKHVPVNPHISYKDIDFKLNENNELNVKVRVDAQDR